MSVRAVENLVVLGATGTVGRNTLAVAALHPDKLKIHALSAHKDVAGLFELCRQFVPAVAVMVDEAAARELKQKLKGAALPTEVRSGSEALCGVVAEAAVHQVMSAIVGAAGLMPTLAAVRAGKRVLLANKEPLVMAGRLLLAEAERSKAVLIPIDSEHNAIFQCLQTLPAGAFRCGATPRGVRRLVLTASGGPFRDTALPELARVTPAQAVRHPNWVMGPKISVDSATMMNKGLELIEAQRVFGMPESRIEVVMHPESVIHSLVEFDDGSTLAQLGQPDMRVPIAHALAWPERWDSGVAGLNLAGLGRLNFQPVDARRFPCVALARSALQAGGVMPNVLNAANEIAVDAFLQERVSFVQIPQVIEQTLDAASGANLPADETLDAVLATDAWARAQARRALIRPFGPPSPGGRRKKIPSPSGRGAGVRARRA
jgi:1-deoxy-D-xylulose-5-phosphate reductoisomerase